MTFYDNLKQICDEKNVSIADLEKAVFGANNRNAYKWRKHTPNVLIAERVADYLDVSIRDLTRGVSRRGMESGEEET